MFKIYEGDKMQRTANMKLKLATPEWPLKGEVEHLFACVLLRGEALDRLLVHTLIGRGAMTSSKGSQPVPYPLDLRQKLGSLKQRPCRLLSPTSRPC